MKDFFLQCLKDLEALTGIRQLYFLQSDLEDGKRKLDVLIEGMIQVSNQFDYITLDNQKKIIRDMMIKDQDYDSLNSRVIYKWLNMNKDIYYTKANTEPETPIKPLTEEESKRVDQLLAEYRKSLIGLNKGQINGWELEAEKIKVEDKQRREGLSLTKQSNYIPPNAEYVIEKELKIQYYRECYDKITGKPLDNWMSFEEWKMR